jgi:mitochondrial intermediate peptidase
MLRGVSRTSLRRLTTGLCRPRNYFVPSCSNIVKKRSLATAAIIPASVDDQSLVSVFDQAGAHFKSPSGSYTGLFGHSTLTSPQAFAALTDSTLLRARLLTERIVRARDSRDEMLKVVKNLDRVSDLLCGVIDMAELIRNAHPSKHWIDSANEAYEKLCEFMNVLNTHVELYEVRMHYKYFKCISIILCMI